MKRRFEHAATVVIFMVLLAPVGIGAYWLMVWGISAVWPVPDRSGTEVQSYGTISFRPPTGAPVIVAAGSTEADDYWSRIESGEPIAYVAMVAAVADMPVYDLPWSDVPTRRRYELSLVPAGSSVPSPVLLPGEEAALLALARHYHGDNLPAPLRTGGANKRVIVLWDGVWHGVTRSLAWLLCAGGVVFGAAWLTRRVRRGRALLGGVCAECGYQITGVRGDRCPECGVRWWEYGEDLSEPGGTPGATA